ncbi:hypothetical protein MRX96_048806, partial [Rhipicephalus microplus]
MNFNASFSPLVKSGIHVKIVTSVDKDALKSKELWVKNPSVTKNIITCCYKEFMHVCNCNGHPTWYSAIQCEQDEVRSQLAVRQPTYFSFKCLRKVVNKGGKCIWCKYLRKDAAEQIKNSTCTFQATLYSSSKVEMHGTK